MAGPGKGPPIGLTASTSAVEFSIYGGGSGCPGAYSTHNWQATRSGNYRGGYGSHRRADYAGPALYSIVRWRKTTSAAGAHFCPGLDSSRAGSSFTITGRAHRCAGYGPSASAHRLTAHPRRAWLQHRSGATRFQYPRFYCRHCQRAARGRFISQGRPADIFTSQLFKQVFDSEVEIMQHPKHHYPLVVQS